MNRFQQTADSLGDEFPSDIRERLIRDLELADLVKRNGTVILQALASYREYMENCAKHAAESFQDGRETGLITADGFRQAALTLYENADGAKRVREEIDLLLNPEHESEDE
jgi:hypothetical protein